MSQSIGAALRHAIRCLERHGVSEPRAAAEVLLSDLLGTTRPQLYLDVACPLSPDQHKRGKPRGSNCSCRAKGSVSPDRHKRGKPGGRTCSCRAKGTISPDWHKRGKPRGRTCSCRAKGSAPTASSYSAGANRPAISPIYGRDQQQVTRLVSLRL